MPLLQAFTAASPYKKRAMLLAIAWTLLIFIACLTPAKDIPEVDIPLIDKWTHFVLFGGFAMLWLCAGPSRRAGRLILIFILSAGLGWLIEELQGLFTSLGRSKDFMDFVADSIGGALGVITFAILAAVAERRLKSKL